MRRRLLSRAVGAFLAVSALFALTALYHSTKPLPAGLSVEAPERFAHDVRFLADLTYVDDAGVRHVDQQVFDEILTIIRSARRRIVLDLFLFNAFQGERREETRALCSELTEALIDRKRSVAGIEIIVITDPINTVYGGVEAPHLERLRAAGIPVVVTNLEALRDSNWFYSSLWRWAFRPLGTGGPGRFRNPFGGDPVSLRTDLRILNFKANHRKTVVADSATGWTGLVTSANPHDGSSAHGNVAIRFAGPAVADLLETERAVAAFSNGPVPEPIEVEPRREEGLRLAVLTEGGIARAVERALSSTAAGDRVDLAMFYLADRGVIRDLIRASARGARVRVLLDPNKDAFGRERNGVPNRPVAAELHRAGIEVRFCDTHGEQCHAKMLLVRSADETTLIAGSANFTRRNLRDLNLETNVRIRGDPGHPALNDAAAYFERVWSNEPGRRFSVEYAAYADESWLKTWLYRASEGTGIGTF